MSQVFVLDMNKKPLDPCCPARARQLLKKGRASVFRRFPFTIILHDRKQEDSVIHEHRLKIDPGSKTTGLAIVHGNCVVWVAELSHRGQRIKNAMLNRCSIRKSRRQRKTRYRQPRFLNRTRANGWLPPSLLSRVCNVMTWMERLRKYCNITALSQELVKFDTQKMQNAEISGVEYQQGEIQGYEVREYLLEKWQRKCAYCKVTGIPLEIEHITPKSRGGSNRVSNLTLACHTCNQNKGNKTATEFGFPKIQVLAKLPLKDAAAVNITRWALYQRLCATGLLVEVGSGSLTKYNRVRLNLQKSHWIDAVCVGHSVPEELDLTVTHYLNIKAFGHGGRQICRINAYGFPNRHRERRKNYFGMQTGDVIKAVVLKGKYAGVWISRVVVKARGWFDLKISEKKASVHHKYCTRLWFDDGYGYTNCAV